MIELTEKGRRELEYRGVAPDSKFVRHILDVLNEEAKAEEEPDTPEEAARRQANSEAETKINREACGEPRSRGIEALSRDELIKLIQDEATANVYLRNKLKFWKQLMKNIEERIEPFFPCTATCIEEAIKEEVS